MLLSQAERRLGLAERLAAVIPDERDASRLSRDQTARMVTAELPGDTSGGKSYRRTNVAT